MDDNSKEKLNNRKSSLVLHICCAPDEAWALECLASDYEITSFFCNPNLFPEDEYYKRLEEAEKVAVSYEVRFESEGYDPEKWKKAVSGFEETPEGGERCEKCFHLRFRRTARFCRENGIDFFTTVMSVSPHKSVKMLDRNAEKAAAEYGVSYLPLNLKKKDGFKKSIQLCRNLDLYRQDYCGCRLSRHERDMRIAQKKECIIKTP